MILNDALDVIDFCETIEVHTTTESEWLTLFEGKRDCCPQYFKDYEVTGIYSADNVTCIGVACCFDKYGDLDESELEWVRFVGKVATYKSMGVRFVVIDWPKEWSVLFAFNTKGENAETIDKKRFLTPAIREWASGFKDFGPDDVVQVLDVTDDLDEMSCYDTCGKFVVQQLA